MNEGDARDARNVLSLVDDLFQSLQYRSGFRSVADDVAPSWIVHDLEVAGAERELWTAFCAQARAAREEGGEGESGGATIQRIVTAGTKAAFNKKVKSKSVVPFLQAYVSKQKVEVECLGRAKSVAAAAAALGERVAIMANETHVFVQLETGQILDFETNLKYKTKLATSARRVPYYYAMVVPLDDRALIATTVLNDGTDDKVALDLIKRLYADGETLSDAPAWVRVFCYERSSPERILDDAEALAHPFVALDFAILLKRPSLLQVALANLACSLYEFSKEFFYDNDGDVNFLSALETLLVDGSIDKADARALLEVSKTRADDCLSKDDAGHYRHRCDALEMQHLPPTGKRRRSGA